MLLQDAEDLYAALRTAAGLEKIPDHSQNAQAVIPLENTILAYQQALEKRPEDPQLYFMLGNAQSQQENYQSSISSYHKALELQYPNPFDLYKRLGESLQESNNISEAIKTYEQGIQKTSHPGLYSLLSKALIQEKRFDAAEETLEKLIILQPDIIQHYLTLGNFYLHQKQDEVAAESAFRKALDLESNHYIARKHLGIALMRQGKIDEALAELQLAYQQHPQKTDIHTPLGQCYQRQKNWQAAIQQYELAIETDGNASFSIYHSLGNIYLRLGDKIKAKDAYERALEQQPNHPQLQQKLE